MRQKADAEKRDEANAKASMSSIEAKAQAQYKRDLKESEQAKQNLTGSWVRGFRLPSRQLTSTPTIATFLDEQILRR